MQKYHEYTVKKVELDSKDRKILEQLNKNARISLTEISKITGIPIDTVKYRIEKMEKEQVFRYATILNPLKLGFPIFNGIYLQLVNFDELQEKKLIGFVKEHPNLVYAAKVVGKYDFAIGILAKDMIQFEKILNDLKTKFQNIIKDIDVLSVIEEYKYDYMIDLIG